MKIITFKDIEDLGIRPAVCMQWVDEMLRNKDKVLLPPKIHMALSDDIFCNVMPSVIPHETLGHRVMGAKLVTRYPQNDPALESVIVLMNADNGEKLAIMDGTWITAMRTGAVAAHSIELLAVKDYTEIGVVGLGNTSRATLAVLGDTVKDREIHIKLLKYKDYADDVIERFKDNKNFIFEVVDSMEDLARGSQVIISGVTYAQDDFLTPEYYEEGCLIVPIHTRGFMECDLVFDKIYGDDYGHVCDFKHFKEYKYFAEVADVLSNKAEGRINNKERIIAYNIGLSIHDMYFAGNIFKKVSDNKDDFDLGKPYKRIWV